MKHKTKITLRVQFGAAEEMLWFFWKNTRKLRILRSLSLNWMVNVWQHRSVETFWCLSWFSSVDFLWSLWIKVHFTFVPMLGVRWCNKVCKWEESCMRTRERLQLRTWILVWTLWFGIVWWVIFCLDVSFMFKLRLNYDCLAGKVFIGEIYIGL